MQLPTTSSAGAAGGKANTIRGVFRIFTMSTSTRGCNNCSFSAKKMHFGWEARGAQERSDGLGGLSCNAMWSEAGELQRGCEFRGLALMGMDLSEVTLMWYDRPCPAATLQCRWKYDVIQGGWEAGIAVSRQKYGRAPPRPSPQLTRPTMLLLGRESI